MKRLIFFLFVFAIGSALSATPPRFFRSDDRLFAVSPTHIYVLRELRDNAGSHFTDRKDVYLVEIDVASGRYVAHWAVSSSVTQSVDGFPGAVIQLEPSSKFVNPYEVVRSRGASLLAEFEPNSDFGYKIKNGSLITNYADSTGASGAKTYYYAADIQALAQNLLTPTTSLYSELDETQIRDMSGAYMQVPDLAQIYNCEVRATAMGIGAWGNARVPIKVQCDIYENEPEMGSVSFYVFAPDWRDSIS